MNQQRLGLRYGRSSVWNSELNVDNWNDNCEAKSEAKSPRPLRGFQVDSSLTRNVRSLRGQIIILFVKERSKVFSEGLLAVNESETLNRSFTIILAVHQPYSIMLHVTYVYMQADLQTA